MGDASRLGLSRENLAAQSLLTLRRGSWANADVLLVRSRRGLVVVKDYAPRARPVRLLLARWLVRREARAYRALSDHPSVPRYLGGLDDLAFAVEFRGGPRFSRRRPWTFSPEFARELGEAVDALHARGVAHLDLGHRDNVRAGLDGRPVLIDFASAVTFRREGLARRLLLPLLETLDRRALRKWTRQVTACQTGPVAVEAARRTERAAPAVR